MFLSKDDLKLGYGVDLEIGKFFVDRRVPERNMYWRNRKLYMVQMPGYIFIPIFTDIEYRLGIQKENLLSESHIILAEAILDSAARLELKELRYRDHVRNCIQLVQLHSRNDEFLQQLSDYLERKDGVSAYPFGYPYHALARADSYLLTLCCFEFDTGLGIKLVKAWKALMMYYLLLDDLEDLKEDFLNKEDNTLLEAGLIDKGPDAIYKILDQSFEIMNGVNPVLANRIDYKRRTLDLQKLKESFLREFPKLSSG